jgi:hypothetical protein
MPVRLKKLVGSLGVLVFLAAYIWGVATLAPLIPPVWWAQLPYFGLAGVLWGAPLLPLIRWMNREG